jgi:hypothetical protein
MRRYARPMRLDHVIWMTDDLDRTAGQLEAEYGLGVSGGGRHDGHGTHNLIVPLGSSFLEILAVEDPDLARASPIGRATAAANEGLYGWVVAVDDVRPHIERLGIGSLTLTRGETVMQLGGVAEAMGSPWLPFFIERPASHMPAWEPAADTEITSLELVGDQRQVETWIAGADIPLTYESGAPQGLRRVTLASGAILGAD